MKTVRDIMTPVVFCVEQTQFIAEAARKLRDYAVSGVPVVDSDGAYVGVLSLTDINGVIAKEYDDVEAMQKVLEGDLPKDFQSLQVKEVMTPHMLRISADATLSELGETLLVAGVHRLMVAEQGEIVGLVSTTDLIHGFLNPPTKTAISPLRPRKPYLFEAEMNLDENGLLLSGSGGELRLEAPPEFGGSGDSFSPEDLFVASIGSCLCLTFRELAKQAGIRIESLSCRAIGRLEGDGTALMFSRVDLYPKVVMKGSVEKAEQVLEQSKLRCLVGRSADVYVVLHPEFKN